MLSKPEFKRHSETQTVKVLYKESTNRTGNYKKIFTHLPVIDNDCYDDFGKDKFVHGPIGEGACVVCHDPHGFVEEKFLREGRKRICYLCHEEKVVKTEHLDNLEETSEKEDCLYCHNPHSGKDKYFLKKN